MRLCLQSGNFAVASPSSTCRIQARKHNMIIAVASISLSTHLTHHILMYSKQLSLTVCVAAHVSTSQQDCSEASRLALKAVRHLS